MARQHIIFNTWLDRRGLEHLKTPTPVIPRITPVFNKQIEIGYIIQEGLSILYSPSSDINSQWAAIALNEVEVKLSRFVENLPTEMRLKEWTSLSEPVQPHLASLHMFFHSTRLCMNRPFLRASAEQAELDIGTKSALMILPATHGLRHAPLIFVHGAIVAFNTIVSLARLPALELALKEMSTTWAIAGIMLGRLKGLLSHPHRNTPHEMQFIEEPMISGEALAEWQDMNFGAWLDLDAMLGSVNNEILWNLDELI
ncbi:hypothetical protein GQ53DRAFT_769525 [Thozetella sp. PMI_491]|nr:hypothetical protein GQ53DRAFT_769525 [Thozetella sp. PMI_491]